METFEKDVRVRVSWVLFISLFGFYFNSLRFKEIMDFVSLQMCHVRE